MNYQFRQEARHRLENAGYEVENAMKALERGATPVSTKGLDPIYSNEVIETYLALIEDSMNVSVYCAFPITVNGEKILAFMVISNDESLWEFPHEMYQGKYPLAFAVNLTGTGSAVIGYLDDSGPEAVLYPYPAV